MAVIEFKPSEEYDLDVFNTTLLKMGWILHLASLTGGEDGMISYGVEKVADAAPTAFSRLTQHVDTDG